MIHSDLYWGQQLVSRNSRSVNPLRATHVHSALPVVTIDVLGFKSLDEGRKSRFEPDGGEGIVFDDFVVVDSQKLMRGCQYCET